MFKFEVIKMKIEIIKNNDIPLLSNNIEDLQIDEFLWDKLTKEINSELANLLNNRLSSVGLDINITYNINSKFFSIDGRGKHDSKEITTFVEDLTSIEKLIKVIR